MSNAMTITFLGTPMTLLGTPVRQGDLAPDFRLMTTDLHWKTLNDYQNTILLIATAPSLDTGVCDRQTRRFNQMATANNDVRVLTVSCDLPFAQSRWCGAAGINALETLSDHYDLNFGLHYGVVVKELRLLARAVFIIDRQRHIQYTEIVPEITQELNFQAAFNSLESLHR